MGGAGKRDGKRKKRERRKRKKVNMYASKRDSDATALFSIPPLSQLSVTDQKNYVVM